MRTQFLITLIAFASACGESPLETAELLSRAKYNDYEKATFSFEHGVRDDPGMATTRNDWDLEFGNGGDFFNVTMVTDDRSRLQDLGALTWAELENREIQVPPPFATPSREARLPVVPGHVYLVRTTDGDSDLAALLRVESLIPGDRVQFTWRLY